MNTKRYIKVTPKGDSRAHILLATNRDFYLSQKATVEEPTEEEVLAAFPELQNDSVREDTLVTTENHTERISAEDYEKRIAELEQENDSLKKEIERLTETSSEKSTRGRKSTKDAADEPSE